MDFSAIVVNYHTDDLLDRFLDSWFQFEPPIESEVIVIDVETDGRSMKHQVGYISTPDNVGFARACNLGATYASGRNIGFFNADTRFLDPTCVEYCSIYLDSNPDVGAVGPMQVDSKGKLTHAGFIGTERTMKARAWQSPHSRQFRVEDEVVSVSGSAYFTRMSTWNEMTQCDLYRQAAPDAVGAFLPTPHFFEETYYSYHLRGHGYKIMYLGTVKMIHEWHKSSPVGSQRANYQISRRLFNTACDLHSLEHS